MEPNFGSKIAAIIFVERLGLQGIPVSGIPFVLPPVIAMTTFTLRKLDIVSRVTVHIFIIELVTATVLGASNPTGFLSGFTSTLVMMAVLQALLALVSRRRPPAGSLHEWDGVAWLLLVASGCHVLAG